MEISFLVRENKVLFNWHHALSFVRVYKLEHGEDDISDQTLYADYSYNNYNQNFNGFALGESFDRRKYLLVPYFNCNGRAVAGERCCVTIEPKEMTVNYKIEVSPDSSTDRSQGFFSRIFHRGNNSARNDMSTIVIRTPCDISKGVIAYKHRDFYFPLGEIKKGKENKFDIPVPYHEGKNLHLFRTVNECSNIRLLKE